MRIFCGLVLLAAALVFWTNPPPENVRTLVDDRPTVLVVCGDNCLPCELLKNGWALSSKANDGGQKWRKWIDANYRVMFLDHDELPPRIQKRVVAVPAAFIHPPGRRRDGPFAIAIDKQQTAVAAFGKVLLKEKRRYARE